jgi:hypothetical protein
VPRGLAVKCTLVGVLNMGVKCTPRPPRNHSTAPLSSVVLAAGSPAGGPVATTAAAAVRLLSLLLRLSLLLLPLLLLLLLQLLLPLVGYNHSCLFFGPQGSHPPTETTTFWFTETGRERALSPATPEPPQQPTAALPQARETPVTFFLNWGELVELAALASHAQTTFCHVTSTFRSQHYY